MLVPQMCLWGSLMSNQTDDEGELRALKQRVRYVGTSCSNRGREKERERESWDRVRRSERLRPPLCGVGKVLD